MWMACYTQEEIAEAVGCDKASVNRVLDDLLQDGKLSDSQQASAFHLTVSVAR
jgi:DNA-binding IclR family transcriptional regulator